VWISEQTATFAVYIINCLVFITVVESAYSAVRTDCLYKVDCVSSLKGVSCNSQIVNQVSRSYVVNTYSVYQVNVVSSPLWRLQDIEENGG
jgi:hypothetical protein